MVAVEVDFDELDEFVAVVGHFEGPHLLGIGRDTFFWGIE
jgi:hypothetical protein